MSGKNINAALLREKGGVEIEVSKSYEGELPFTAKYLYHLNEEKILKNNVPPGKIVKNGSLYDKSLDVRSVHSTATS